MLAGGGCVEGGRRCGWRGSGLASRGISVHGGQQLYLCLNSMLVLFIPPLLVTCDSFVFTIARLGPFV